MSEYVNQALKDAITTKLVVPVEVLVDLLEKYGVKPGEDE